MSERIVIEMRESENHALRHLFAAPEKMDRETAVAVFDRTVASVKDIDGYMWHDAVEALRLRGFTAVFTNFQIEPSNVDW